MVIMIFRQYINKKFGFVGYHEIFKKKTQINTVKR